MLANLDINQDGAGESYNLMAGTLYLDGSSSGMQRDFWAGQLVGNTVYAPPMWFVLVRRSLYLYWYIFKADVLGTYLRMGNSRIPRWQNENGNDPQDFFGEGTTDEAMIFDSDVPPDYSPDRFMDTGGSPRPRFYGEFGGTNRTLVSNPNSDWRDDTTRNFPSGDTIRIRTLAFTQFRPLINYNGSTLNARPYMEMGFRLGSDAGYTTASGWMGEAGKPVDLIGRDLTLSSTDTLIYRVMPYDQNLTPLRVSPYFDDITVTYYLDGGPSLLAWYYVSETIKGKPTLAPEDQNKTFEQLDREGKLPWRMVRSQFFQALQQSFRICAVEDPGYRELALVYDDFQQIVLKTARKFWKLFPDPKLPPLELEPLRLEWEEFEGQLLSLWEELVQKRERTSLLYGDSASGSQSRSSREINAIVAKLDRLQGELEELRRGISSYLNEEPEAPQPELLEEMLVAHVWELGREVHAQAVGAVEETYRSLTAIETLYRVRSGMGGAERDKPEAVKEAVQRWESSPHPEARALCRNKADYLVELGGIHSSLIAFRRDGEAIAELDERMEDFKDLCLEVTEDLDRVDEVTRAVEELNVAWRALKEPPVRRQ